MNPHRRRRVRLKALFLGIFASLHFWPVDTQSGLLPDTPVFAAWLQSIGIVYLLARAYLDAAAIERRFLLALAYFFGMTSSLVFGADVRESLQRTGVSLAGVLILVVVHLAQTIQRRRAQPRHRT